MHGGHVVRDADHVEVERRVVEQTVGGQGNRISRLPDGTGIEERRRHRWKPIPSLAPVERHLAPHPVPTGADGRRKHPRHVRVTDQAQTRRHVREVFLGLGQPVHVLPRAGVGGMNGFERLRAVRLVEALQPSEGVGRQRGRLLLEDRPNDRRRTDHQWTSRDDVEEPRIVVSHERHLRCQIHEARDHLFDPWVVTDRVPEEQDLVVATKAGIFENGIQRDDVAVDVAQKQVSHALTIAPIARRSGWRRRENAARYTRVVSRLRGWTSFTWLTLLSLVLGVGSAQVTVPTLGVRGSVPADVVDAVTGGIRERLRSVGILVFDGALITPGIAGSLEPEFTRLIGRIDGAAFAVSGEVTPAADGSEGRFVVTILAVGVEEDRASDLLSITVDLATAADGGRALGSAVAEFVMRRPSLPEGNGGLFVTSDPRGADLTVDGIALGTVPDVGPLSVAPGRYRLELRLDGFVHETRIVDVADGETSFVHVTMTANAGGSIRIRTEPQARVVLDGDVVGVTPLTLPAPVGTRRLVLVRDGFVSKEIEVLVRANRVTRVDDVLVPAAPLLLFWEEDAGAVVRIDGRVQTGAASDALMPGVRIVEVIRPGTRSSETFVFPNEGTFRLDLATNEIVPFVTNEP